MKISRSESSEYLPAPKITNVEDYLYTSTIYPLFDSSGVVKGNSSMGSLGPSDVEVQTDACFEILLDYLKEFGSDFSKLIKVEVCLASEKDFIDFKAIADTQKKYSILPLGLSESERENLLRTTLRGKREEILKPAIEERREIIRDQQGAVPQTLIPNVPMPNIAPVTAAVDQNTGLTRTEQALLSPEEQLIAQRNKGILSLV